MKITDILRDGKRHMSCEVFPPKTEEEYDSVCGKIEKIAQLKPSYISVTYGAGGSKVRNTAGIAQTIIEKYNVPAMAHLTCVTSDKDSIYGVIDDLSSRGIENIMALRGDIPEEMKTKGEDSLCFAHASDLVNILSSGAYDFCIAGAAYPEKHPEAYSLQEDIQHLKIKVDAGCNFLTTQMFFDNSIYYGFVENCMKAGITVPIVPGIMPLTSKKQFNMAVNLCQCKVPDECLQYADKYADDAESMKKAGIEYAFKQIGDLYEHGVNNVHLYSLNNYKTTETIINEFFGNSKDI